ncbi:MAG TPA: C25 family cysteine peptidase [Chitinophagaceae bacterium]|nr:C25 family cysteine peptidase [Chitinophagaceae bacterium]
MKRILSFLLLSLSLYTQAQVYNNEWIDYNKTYYKFKIGATGLYRISQSTLTSIGLDTVPAENFQLWRNGKEIPLYTSVQTGVMGATDYIEFWGEMNDGKPDNALYRQPDFQMNDKYSLQTDTAAFFLTVNPSGSNLRLVPTANTIVGSPTPEPYFIYTAGMYYKSKINPGFAAVVVPDYVYSSSYDQDEGWTSADIDSAASNTTTQSSLFPYTGAGAPQSVFKINAAGNALNTRNFEVKINGTSIWTQNLDFYDYVKAVVPINTSLFSSGTAVVNVINHASVKPDRMVIAQYELTYPRQFNFGGATSFSFELPASVTGNYLEISNFNYGGIAPVLYDLTNGTRYVADISNPALIKIALQPSAVNRKLLLVNENPSNVKSVTTFQQKNFQDLSLTANQGDYLIITNSALLNASNGSHPVDDYIAYRSSAAGGGYTARMYLVSELVDQFGFGIKMDPIAIRNFIRWARANFSNPLKDVFLIGKGITYDQFRTKESDPNMSKLFFVPTFGNPASDNLFCTEPGNNIPLTPIGRLSVINADEIIPYLKKVKEYEQAQATSSSTIQDKAWMKTVVHLVGADDPILQSDLGNRMEIYRQIISDTLFGGNVTTFNKNSADALQLLNNSAMQNLFQQGIGLITYFGHSSSTALDFNLDNPEQYNNAGKYPFMIVMGCLAGNIFDYNAQRIQTKASISEQYVLSDQHGAIGFLASTYFSIVQYLDIINTQTYKAISRNSYGKTLGEIIDNAISQTFNITTQNDFYARFHCEQVALNGDPAVRLNTFSKPDYVIEDPQVKVSPQFISVAEDHFTLRANILNLGEAINKNIVVEVKRTFPDQSTAVVERDTIPGIRFVDSLTINIPIVATRDKGLNKITITVNADNAVDELYENNNTITKDIIIYEDEANPVYPYNYAMINRNNIKLFASTANPFADSKQYIMELDTTESFNSPIKITRTINSSGGLLEFTPGLTFTDSTVYYWRVAPVPASGQPVWNEASFQYINNSNFGFSQAHFYQYQKSAVDRLSLDTTLRTWKFGSILNNLFVRVGSWVTSSSQESGFSVVVNTNPSIHNTCWFQSLVFNVFDPATFKPWVNTTIDNIAPIGHGLYGSASNSCSSGRQNNFEFRWDSATSRKRAMDFMRDTIPDGAFVVVRTFLLDPVKFPTYASMLRYASDWQADEAIYGPGQSLYQYLKNAGLSSIDSFYRPRQFALVYKKNDPSFTPKWIMSDGTYDNITLSVDCFTPDSLGYITSPVFGPSKGWKNLRWSGTADAISGDKATIDVIGIKTDGSQTTLFSGLDESQQDFDVSSMNAGIYPYAQLRLRTEDTVKYTPYQLKYWELTYDPAPEGAIAPNIFLQAKDTVDVGEPLDFKAAFKNVSDAPFDSLKIKMIVTDKNNVPNIIPVPRRRPLPVGDTIQAGGIVKTANLPGLNTLYIDVNPDNDQPEQYHFNNFAYRNFYVKPDSLNPLLDVTFDGVHILNEDIVSSKPDILVKLKDESKWMILDDTSLLTLQVQYPDGTIRRFNFNNDTLQFIPAGQAPNPDNTASINFRPYFDQDGEYQLIVTGKDRSENTAGNIEYRVAFEVINKPMISNMLNYPNPFTTSTAFVFTITGSEVPQNIKIEIMTITGRIVREITKDELGPLHIGRNITEFKWDGTDQYGSKLANGIYLYRVVTNLNGKSLDKYKSDGDNTDKYFTKGYGKMYLMR